MKFLIVFISAFLVVACGVKTKKSNSSSSISQLSSCTSAEVCEVNILQRQPEMIISFPISSNETGNYTLELCSDGSSSCYPVDSISCSSGTCNSVTRGASAQLQGSNLVLEYDQWISGSDSIRIYRM